VAQVAEVLSDPVLGKVGWNDAVLRCPSLAITSGLERQPRVAVALDNDAATEDVEFHAGGGAAASRLALMDSIVASRTTCNRA